MKRNNIKYLAIFFLMVCTSVSATTGAVAWKDSGAIVNAQMDEKQLTRSLAPVGNGELNVTLSTGEKVFLVGGVYVVSTDREAVISWIKNKGYEYKLDRYSPDTLIIKSSAAEAIEIANEVAMIKGVTTAAPQQRRVFHKR